MKKTWIALFLALCMLTTLTAASACCAEPSDMDKTQTMEETCPCMMDGKGVDGCACMKGMCDEKCGCGETCDCAEKKLEMLTAEMNGVFEANMDLWNKFFGMLDKQPDMDMTYADYLTEQLEAAKESFTEDEYKTLQQDIETIRRLDEEMAAHACDAGELNRLYQEKQEVEARLEQEMARWEELSLQIEE